MPATWPSPAKKKSAVCQLAAENTQNKTQDLVKTRVNGLWLKKSQTQIDEVTSNQLVTYK